MKPESIQQIATGEWSVITVSFKISDVTGDPAGTEKLFLWTRDQDHLNLRWTEQDGPAFDGSLYIDDWREFLQGVSRRLPHSWVEGRDLDGPMSEGNLPSILRRLTTTPAYQLFLAGVDLIAYLELNRPESPDAPHFFPYLVRRRFEDLSGFIQTAIGGGRLFFPATELVSGDSHALDELVANGKLGVAQLSSDDAAPNPKYYVPYAVPMGFATDVSRIGRQIWDRIRDNYYDERD